MRRENMKKLMTTAAVLLTALISSHNARAEVTNVQCENGVTMSCDNDFIPASDCLLNAYNLGGESCSIVVGVAFDSGDNPDVRSTLKSDSSKEIRIRHD